MPTTAAKLSCQPTSPAARGSRPRVTAAASRSTYQRDRGRSASAATIPAAPITPARWIDGPGAGDQHVDADQQADRDQAGADRDPEQRQHRGGEHREQDHVLARDGEQVGEPGALEVVHGPLVDQVVLAEDEAAQQVGRGLRRPGGQRRLGARAHAVEQPR